MLSSHQKLLILGLMTVSGCMSPPGVECVTRNVLGDKIPQEALDCGSFFISAVDGVNSLENPEALACANRSLSRSVPFVVRRNEVVPSACSSPGMCPLSRNAVSAWIGDTVDGNFVIKQVFDNNEASLPSMPLRAHTRSCIPVMGSTLRLVTPSTRRISIVCQAGSGQVELDELPAESMCSSRDQ